MSYFYIASPYSASMKDGSNPSHKCMCARAELVSLYAAWCLSVGDVVFSPIAHGHYLQTLYNLPKTWEFWWEIDRSYLERAEGLRVYQMDGWDRSVGVQEEIQFSMEKGMPVTYVVPQSIHYENADVRIRNLVHLC